MTKGPVDLFENITRMVRSSADLDNLLAVIVLATMKVMNAKASSLLLLDEKSDKLYFHICVGEKGDEVKKYEMDKEEGIAGWVIKHGKPRLAADVSRDPFWAPEISNSVGVETNSLAAAPLKAGDEVFGVLEVIDRQDGTCLVEEDLDRLQAFTDLASGLLLQARVYRDISTQNKLLKRELDSRNEIIGQSASIKKSIEDCRKIAHSKVTTLITGESGIGKELFARLIHNLSPRRDKPMIAINCGALPESLLERELFGHEKGAFTGADSRMPGLFEAADHGSIFLDEIGETSPAMQVKLLRVLQEGTFFRLGGQNMIKVDVRVLAATNRDLKKLVAERLFREDLFYRLNVVNIELPPLRERGDDISILANYFLKKFSSEFNNTVRSLSPDTLAALMNYSWPGNVRQLENTIERAVIMSEKDIIGMEDLPEEITEFKGCAVKVGATLKEAQDNFKREFINKSLAFCAGNKTKTAQMLGIQRTYLSRLLKELEI